MSKSISTLHQKLVKDAAFAPLSQLLPQTLTLARKVKNKDLEKWVRLELDGYFSANPMFAKEDIVPKYRTVAGQRYDESRRLFMLTNQGLEFINEDRLRNGVAELEHLAISKEMISYRDLHSARIIRETFGVEVTIFAFHPSEIHGVLSRIRTRLVEWLSDIEPEVEKSNDVLDQTEPQHRMESLRSSKWRIIAISLFAVSFITAVTFFVSDSLQPILPSNMNYTILLLIASLTGVLGVLASLNDAIELFQKLFGDKSNSQLNTKNELLGKYVLALYFHRNPPYNAAKMLYTGSEIARDLEVKILYKDSNGNEQTQIVTDFFPKEDPKMIWHYYKHDFLEPNQVTYFHLLKKTSTLNGKVKVVVRFVGAQSGRPRQIENEFDLEDF